MVGMQSQALPADWEACGCTGGPQMTKSHSSPPHANLSFYLHNHCASLLVCEKSIGSTDIYAAVQAAISVSNIVRTSLGPVGLDKMMVDDVGVSGHHFIPQHHLLANAVVCLY
jgi:hypothetical protein